MYALKGILKVPTDISSPEDIAYVIILVDETGVNIAVDKLAMRRQVVEKLCVRR